MIGLLLSLLAVADEPSALAAAPDGWEDLLPPPDLAGWTRVAPTSTAGVPAWVDDRQLVWVVDRAAGVLDCRGDLPAGRAGGKGGSHEMLRYDRELGDFVFHVEWRFTDPNHAGWNAGVYARASADGRLWHQAQVGGPASGYWFGDTLDDRGRVVRRRIDAREARVRPPGEWNVYEITARGDTLSLWVNGATVAVWRGLRVRRGHVGLEAELHHVQFRNLALKELATREP